MSSLADKYGARGADPRGADPRGADLRGADPGERRTLRAPISCVGHGLHGGEPARLVLLPAAAGAGIVFVRVDLGVSIPARFDHVIDTRLCTVLGLPGNPAARVGTVEHLMAALSAAGIDDLRIEIDGPEVPILDGSAEPFLFLLRSAGIVAHGRRRDMIEVLRPVGVTQGAARAQLAPHHGTGLALTLDIDFPAAAIGAQSLTFDLAAERFAGIAAARTFTMLQEVEAMREAGLAKGGSLANAIVVDGAKVLNPEGLRFPDEFVRHKMLDVVGDLALAGAPLIGRFTGHCTGHGVNNRLLRALFADRANYRVATSHDLPLPAVA